ncbi:MAG: hypothetical protein LBI28_12415 [Treponema sp.]|jgi:hypothetical protein|nr:hypothetical protein [Treponema sp.]
MHDEIFSDEYLKKCWNILDKKTKFIFLLILIHLIIISLIFLNGFFPNLFHSGLFFNLITGYFFWISWIMSIIIILYCKNKLKQYKNNILIKILLVLSLIHVILYFVGLILLFIFGMG